MDKTLQKGKVILDQKDLEELKTKASLFEEILSFLEDKYLGRLMQKTEREKNISLSKTKRYFK